MVCYIVQQPWVVILYIQSQCREGVNMNAEKMKNRMTIFYFKSTGKIYAVATGIQDTKYFGDNEEDFKLIIDYIVVLKDETVINDFTKFKINTETKQIEILQSAIPNYNYPVAQN